MIIKEFDMNDVFTISEIIDKMGLESDINKITNTIQTSKLENKKDATALGKEIAVGLGVDIVTKMIRNLHKAKKEVKCLIASLTGLTEAEAGKMSFKQLKDFFAELFETEGIGDFLSQAGESSEMN